MSDRRGQKHIKMCTIHENALMRSAIDHDIGSIFPMLGGLRYPYKGLTFTAEGITKPDATAPLLAGGREDRSRFAFTGAILPVLYLLLEVH